MINLLHEWQTLIGSIIGGIVGLLAALLVAYKERRRDENASAMLLISDLTVFMGAASMALGNQSDNNTDKAKVNSAYRLVKLTPTLSPMFDASRVRVMSVDNKLAAHLSSFKMLYTGIIQILNRLSSQFDKEDKTVLENNQYVLADANKLAQGLNLAIKQAEFAIYFLEELFLRRCAWWIRLTLPIRRRMYPTPKDLESEKALHPN